MDTIDEEEMKEQLAEEMAKYEDEGYFKRLFKMFAGLGKKHSSREYKEAVIEPRFSPFSSPSLGPPSCSW